MMYIKINAMTELFNQMLILPFFSYMMYPAIAAWAEGTWERSDRIFRSHKDTSIPHLMPNSGGIAC